MASTTTQAPGSAEGAAVSFAEAWRTWLKIGLLGFGGPAGQIALMHRILVDEKRWVSEARFLHALNYCMLLPGPEAQQLATYVGWLLHRTLGGVVAGTLFVLPGFVVIVTLSTIYALFQDTPALETLFFGLKAAVLAVVIEAVLRVGRRALKNRAMVALAAVAFVAIFALGVPFPLIVLGAGLIGLIGAQAAARPVRAVDARACGRRRDCAGAPDGAQRAVAGGRRAGDPGLGRVVGSTAAAAGGDLRRVQRLRHDGRVLLEDGGGDLRRRLRGPGLRGPAGRGDAGLAAAGRDAGRPRHGRDHARAADPGADLCRLPGLLPRRNRARPADRRLRWAPC